MSWNTHMMGLSHLNRRIVLRGLLSYFPGCLQLLGKKKRGSKGSGGTTSARYCYSVWLRHLVMLQKAGMSAYPNAIGEIGPGDSLGIGIMWLIGGAEKYYAIDLIEHSSVERNLAILEELCEIFRTKTPVPGRDEFPLLEPALDDYSSPVHFFSEEKIDTLLHRARIINIRRALIDGACEKFSVHYSRPSAAGIPAHALHLIYSQAVLEHVNDIESLLASTYAWLLPGAYASHQIDYSAHEISATWNAHWYTPSWLWRVLMHGRSYDINRMPHSYFVNAFAEARFEQVLVQPLMQKSALADACRPDEVPLTKTDRIIRSAHFICRKRAS